MHALRLSLRLLLLLLVCCAGLLAHDSTPVTHSFDRGSATSGPRLILSITDPQTGQFLAARFSITVDGTPYRPKWIDENGIRFTSIHRSKKEEFTALYTRGTGPVTVSLPAGARNVEVTATRGFEYMPTTASARIEHDRVSLGIGLSRWIDMAALGWISVDEHLHYDRLDASGDSTWLTMLEADGLTAGHFMTLKGGMMPGVWARQFAHGIEGQATDGSRLIVPGQEYRDSAQGHVNLLGLDEIIEPISTGGLGTPAILENFPPLHDVLLKARAANGLTGIAHAGRLGRHPTAIADVVLGAVDFWELSNGFIYSTDTWYRLLNCGYFLPPAAGTDLPNSPFRESWQPMLGAVRTYVHTGGRIDFPSFKAAMARGRVFITGGPMISITADGKGPGETIRLPPEGGTVFVRAELSSPRPLRELHLVHDGRSVNTTRIESSAGSIQRQRVEYKVVFEQSGWLAAWGKGEAIAAQGIDAMAHTGAVRVLVGDRPVRSAEDLGHFIALLTRQRGYYLKHGQYRSEAERLHLAKTFERALDQLRTRLEQ